MVAGKYIRTNEIKRRISKKLIGRKLSKETIKKMKKNRKGMLGKNHSKKTKLKISKAKKGQHNSPNTEWKKGHKTWNKGKKMSDTFRLNCRKKQLKYIQECLKNKLPIHPNIGKNETKILNQIEEVLDYKIIRQYHIKNFCYWVDGYIPELNLVIEIDESFHFNKNGKLNERDIIRQKEIEKILNCEFLRIKEDEYVLD